MKKTEFKVLRAFRVLDQVHPVGESVSLDDADLVSDLLATGRIEAADQATADRIKSKPLFEWTEDGPQGPHAPAMRVRL